MLNTTSQKNIKESPLPRKGVSSGEREEKIRKKKRVVIQGEECFGWGMHRIPQRHWKETPNLGWGEDSREMARECFLKEVTWVKFKLKKDIDSTKIRSLPCAHVFGTQSKIDTIPALEKFEVQWIGQTRSQVTILQGLWQGPSCSPDILCSCRWYSEPSCY